MHNFFSQKVSDKQKINFYVTLEFDFEHILTKQKS